MSILKKITDKYVSLRFLNKKITKLCFLSAALVGLCLSSGYSFAKYRDENYDGGNAGLAVLGDVVVSYTDGTIVTTNQLPNSGTTTDKGWHAFLATIKVQFFNVDVKQKFSISFKLGHKDNKKYSDSNLPESTSFALPNNVSDTDVSSISTYAKKNSTSSVEKVSVVDAKNNNYIGWEKFNVSSLNKNTGYYSFDYSYDSNQKSNDLNYSNWYTNVFNNDNLNKNIITTDFNFVSPEKETTIFFYKILYFVNFDLNNTTKEIIAEESKIFYEITGEQVQ